MLDLQWPVGGIAEPLHFVGRERWRDLIPDRSSIEPGVLGLQQTSGRYTVGNITEQMPGKARIGLAGTAAAAGGASGEKSSAIHAISVATLNAACLLNCGCPDRARSPPRFCALRS
jgi:hypothetical protein